jgi:hypothetical protein
MITIKTLNPNDFGKNILVEDCQKIKIKDFLRTCRTELKKTILNSEIEMMGMNIGLATSKTCFNGIRFWFMCPQCNKRAGVLFSHPITNKIGCRTCLKLNYKKRRYKGMIEEKAATNFNNAKSQRLVKTYQPEDMKQ